MRFTERLIHHRKMHLLTHLVLLGSASSPMCAHEPARLDLDFERQQQSSVNQDDVQAPSVAPRGWREVRDRLVPVSDSRFQRAFHQPDGKERWLCYQALYSLIDSGSIGGGRASALLCEALSSEADHGSRLLLVEYAGYVDGGTSELRELLQGLSNSRDVEIAVEAICALERQGYRQPDRILDLYARVGRESHQGQRLAYTFLRNATAADIVGIRLLSETGMTATRTFAHRVLAEFQPEARWRDTRAYVLDGVQRNERGKKRLQKPGAWQEAPASMIEDSLASARVALLGEMHVDAGPLRDSQMSFVDAFAEGGGALYIGYEPSVYRAQASVVEYAEERGFTPISMEPNSEANLARGETRARDDECAETINEFLSQDKNNRLLALRGESHLMPGGTLLLHLRESPVVVLSGAVLAPHWCDYPETLSEGEGSFFSPIARNFYLRNCFGQH